MVGFDIRNKDTFNTAYLCRICTYLLRDPMQLDCGHRCCNSCIQRQLNVIKCTICSKETLRHMMFIDRGVKNDMEDLRIICSFCNWDGVFKHYQDHLNEHHSSRCADQMSKSHVVFQIQQLIEKNKEFTKNIRMLKTTIDQHFFQLSAYKLSIEEQTPPLQILQQIDHCVTSYYGNLLWKIDDIKKKLSGQSDTQPYSLTSPPFYTSQDGYKMCVRLYFHQDNVTHSTHVSIDLILMRGEYDALLEWPFDHQVIFCVYDQNNQTNHIIKSFQSHTNLKSFQRPNSEMNDGCGLSMLFSLSNIEEENDTMYVRVMVRKDRIPEKLLEYVMSINPAFPLCKQEELIREEIRKHQLPQYRLVLTLK